MEKAKLIAAAIWSEWHIVEGLVACRSRGTEVGALLVKATSLHRLPLPTGKSCLPRLLPAAGAACSAVWLSPAPPGAPAPAESTGPSVSRLAALPGTSGFLALT